MQPKDPTARIDDQRDGGDEVDAAQRLERPDDRLQAMRSSFSPAAREMVPNPASTGH
jgi:hypothetical protein